MAGRLSRKQLSIVVGAAVAAVALVAGVSLAVVNGAQASTAAGGPGASTGAIASGAQGSQHASDASSITWIDGGRVDAAVAALQASGFHPVSPGKLTVAVSPLSPPLAFIPEGSNDPAGFDVNLAKLVAQALGLEYAPVAVSWADWPLGVQSGKYDAVISNVAITPERLQTYDFTSYRSALHGFYVKADSAVATIAKPEDAAGLRVIVGSGTNQENILLRWNEILASQGLAPIELRYYDDQSAAQLAIQSGRADALFGPNESYSWQAAHGAAIRNAGVIPGRWPDSVEVGVTTAKGGGLAEPVRVAVQALIDDGTYGRLLDVWALGDSGIATARVNPTTAEH